MADRLTDARLHEVATEVRKVAASDAQVVVTRGGVLYPAGLVSSELLSLCEEVSLLRRHPSARASSEPRDTTIDGLISQARERLAASIAAGQSERAESWGRLLVTLLRCDDTPTRTAEPPRVSKPGLKQETLGASVPEVVVRAALWQHEEAQNLLTAHGVPDLVYMPGPSRAVPDRIRWLLGQLKGAASASASVPVNIPEGEAPIRFQDERPTTCPATPRAGAPDPVSATRAREGVLKPLDQCAWCRKRQPVAHPAVTDGPGRPVCRECAVKALVQDMTQHGQKQVLAWTTGLLSKDTPRQGVLEPVAQPRLGILVPLDVIRPVLPWLEAWVAGWAPSAAPSDDEKAAFLRALKAKPSPLTSVGAAHAAAPESAPVAPIGNEMLANATRDRISAEVAKLVPTDGISSRSKTELLRLVNELHTVALAGVPSTRIRALEDVAFAARDMQQGVAGAQMRLEEALTALDGVR